MSFKVYKLSFLRLGEQDHVALYVANNDTSGTLFHAIDDGAESTKEEVKQKFQKKEFTPETSASLRNDLTVEVGTVKKSKFDTFSSVCAQVGNPSGPRKMKNRPNCVTWAENALHDLNQTGVLQLKPGYKVISSKKTLNVPMPAPNKPTQSKAGPSK